MERQDTTSFRVSKLPWSVWPTELPNATANPTTNATGSKTQRIEVVSVMAGLPSYRADELEKWNLNAAECSGCLTVVPHNQLHVCMKNECEYKLNDTIEIEVPTQFFNRQKVFCGRCAFRGCHAPHQRDVRSALKMAIYVCSRNMENSLVKQFENLAFINNEEPVDYMISSELNTPQLPVLPIFEYLAASDTTCEWLQKKKTLEDVESGIAECRQQGHEFVLDMAKTILKTYTELQKDINKELNSTKPDEKRIQKMQFEEHQSRMHLKPREESKPREEDSRPASVLNESQLPQAEAANSAPLEHAASSSSVSTDTVVVKQEIVEEPQPQSSESVVKMLCSSLALRFDSIRDEMKLEDALKDVSIVLDENTASIEQKLEAAQLFKKKTSFALYYPLPS